MSAFEGTFLNIALRDASLDCFIIAGIALEIGIGPTVRQALYLNYVPLVVSEPAQPRPRKIKNAY